MSSAWSHCACASPLIGRRIGLYPCFGDDDGIMRAAIGIDHRLNAAVCRGIDTVPDGLIHSLPRYGHIIMLHNAGADEDVDREGVTSVMLPNAGACVTLSVRLTDP